MKTTHFFTENNPLLFPVEVDVTLRGVLSNAFELLDREPVILDMIREDLDAWGLRKKRMRLADAAWTRKLTLPLGLEEVEPGGSAPEVVLGTGRPRLSEKAVYLCLMLRGYLNSLTDREACERIRDSITVQCFFRTHGLGSLPARSTMHENVQAVSDRTRQHIFLRHLVMVGEEGLDDFRSVTLDSTAVKANSCWPTDSGLVRDVLHRAYRNSQSLRQYGVPNLMPWHASLWLAKIRALDFRISVASGKGSTKKRKVLYRSLYSEAGKLIKHIRKELQKHRVSHASAALPPTLAGRLRELLCSIEDDLLVAERVIGYSTERVLKGKGVDLAEKVVSLSDGSAAFIAKGGRETVIGYRPQVGRSGNGFVTVLHVPEGNANDAPLLHSLVREVIGNTGVTPKNVSTDDGYSSRNGRLEVLSIEGLDALSLSGSKGRALTPVEAWDSEQYQELRRNRSSVESLIFMLKYVFGFGRVRRRGIEAVRTELLEKVIVHNMMRMVVLRKRRQKASQTA